MCKARVGIIIIIIHPIIHLDPFYTCEMYYCVNTTSSSLNPLGIIIKYVRTLTVITPRFPTLSIASEISLPISLSPLAEIVAT